MMRHILCARCLEPHLPEGTRQIYAANDLEPAEYQRLTLGVAGLPKPEQRWMRISGVRTELPLDYFECDTCSGHIKPGDRCAAWSVWVDGQEPVPEWEQEYLAEAA